jgi:alpha-ketoglutaric semialdehyde dehydrogenase
VAAIFTSSGTIVRNFLDEPGWGGLLKVNQSISGAAVDSSFGGWKASGLGAPEHGPFDVEFFAHPQTMYSEASKAGGKS